MQKYIDFEFKFETEPKNIGLNNAYKNSTRKGRRGRYLDPKAKAYKLFLEERIKEKIIKEGFDLLNKEFDEETGRLKKTVLLKVDFHFGKKSRDKDTDGLVKLLQDSFTGLVVEDDAMFATPDPLQFYDLDYKGLEIYAYIYRFDLNEYLKKRNYD